MPLLPTPLDRQRLQVSEADINALIEHLQTFMYSSDPEKEITSPKYAIDRNGNFALEIRRDFMAFSHLKVCSWSTNMVRKILSWNSESKPNLKSDHVSRRSRLNLRYVQKETLESCMQSASSLEDRLEFAKKWTSFPQNDLKAARVWLRNQLTNSNLICFLLNVEETELDYVAVVFLSNEQRSAWVFDAGFDIIFSENRQQIIKLKLREILSFLYPPEASSKVQDKPFHIDIFDQSELQEALRFLPIGWSSCGAQILALAFFRKCFDFLPSSRKTLKPLQLAEPFPEFFLKSAKYFTNLFKTAISERRLKCGLQNNEWKCNLWRCLLTTSLGSQLAEKVCPREKWTLINSGATEFPEKFPPFNAENQLASPDTIAKNVVMPRTDLKTNTRHHPSLTDGTVYCINSDGDNNEENRNGGNEIRSSVIKFVSVKADPVNPVRDSVIRFNLSLLTSAKPHRSQCTETSEPISVAILPSQPKNQLQKLIKSEPDTVMMESPNSYQQSLQKNDLVSPKSIDSYSLKNNPMVNHLYKRETSAEQISKSEDENIPSPEVRISAFVSFFNELAPKSESSPYNSVRLSGEEKSKVTSINTGFYDEISDYDEEYNSSSDLNEEDYLDGAAVVDVFDAVMSTSDALSKPVQESVPIISHQVFEELSSDEESSSSAELTTNSQEPEIQFDSPSHIEEEILCREEIINCCEIKVENLYSCHESSHLTGLVDCSVTSQENVPSSAHEIANLNEVIHVEETENNAVESQKNRSNYSADTTQTTDRLTFMRNYKIPRLPRLKSLPKKTTSASGFGLAPINGHAGSPEAENKDTSIVIESRLTKHIKRTHSEEAPSCLSKQSNRNQLHQSFSTSALPSDDSKNEHHVDTREVRTHFQKIDERSRLDRNFVPEWESVGTKFENFLLEKDPRQNLQISKQAQRLVPSVSVPNPTTSENLYDRVKLKGHCKGNFTHPTNSASPFYLRSQLQSCRRKSKRYVCLFCDKVKQRSHQENSFIEMKHHFRGHLKDVRPYKCMVADCFQWFSSPRMLEAHAGQMGLRRCNHPCYVCNVCHGLYKSAQKFLKHYNDAHPNVKVSDIQSLLQTIGCYDPERDIKDDSPEIRKYILERV